MGALSVLKGRVTIQGSIEEGDDGQLFWFRWHESGGPRVNAPTQKGIGTVILKEMAKRFAHHIDLEYLPEGLRYALSARLSAIAPSKDGSTESASVLPLQRASMPKPASLDPTASAG